jgi:multiple sugar transport system permease protein
VYFWTQFGFNIVIYLAALQDIPQEVLEAASIDGASRWAKFWHVTLPTVRPVTIFLLVWGLIDVFQFFTAGYGAAVAYVLFFTSLIVTVAALAYGRRRRITL